MGDRKGSSKVAAPPGQLFGYLSDIRHLPPYFAAMTSADPGQEAVQVTAEVTGTRREGEVWFRI
jgi:hypothetical protein